MKTYKVIYTISNQPGQKVTFVQAWNAIDAQVKAYNELGGFNSKASIWKIEET